MMMATNLTLLLTSVLVGCAPVAPQRTYDGHTWLAMPQAEREKFVDGYIASSLVAEVTPRLDGRLP